MSKETGRCGNCANWKEHNDGYGFGDCRCVFTARLITSRYTLCVGDTVKFKFKAKEEE